MYSEHSIEEVREFLGCEGCEWYGRCRLGTEYDDGNGGLKNSKLVPWINYSYKSPCFLLTKEDTQLWVDCEGKPDFIEVEGW